MRRRARRPSIVVAKRDGVWGVNYANGMPEVCFRDKRAAVAAAAAAALREGCEYVVSRDGDGAQEYAR